MLIAAAFSQSRACTHHAPPLAAFLCALGSCPRTHLTAWKAAILTPPPPMQAVPGDFLAAWLRLQSISRKSQGEMKKGSGNFSPHPLSPCFGVMCPAAPVSFHRWAPVTLVAQYPPGFSLRLAFPVPPTTWMIMSSCSFLGPSPSLARPFNLAHSSMRGPVLNSLLFIHLRGILFPKGP